MKRTEFLLLTLMVGSLVCINLDFISLIDKWKIKYNIYVLAKNKTVYIPDLSDLLYYENKELLKKDDFEKKDVYGMHLIKAMYNLRDLPEVEIQKLLFSKCPNLRVYGYIYYLRKNQDVYFEYLLRSFDCNDVVLLNHKYINGECYVRDVLLLTALKGVELANILPRSKSFLYELTFEQLEILKNIYKENKSCNDIMNKVIEDYFEMYWMIL